MIKLIIFDWDDVFSIGSKEGYYKCFQIMLDELGIKIDHEEMKKRLMPLWGMPYPKLVEELLRGRPELVEKGCKIYYKHRTGETFLNSPHLIPSGNELLERLNKKYTLAVATGALAHVLKKNFFPRFNIPDVFSEIISVHDLVDKSLAKPHPHIVQEIMRRTGFKPGETVMVGDAKNDVVMAQNAHVIPIVVLTGHLNKKEAEELGVNYIIPDVTHLESVLKKL
ncbi:MAG TPA: HAD family hydrolase [Candidatus Acidoferrales bacterium]|nr:HAD family hydrolase [Candidatus Acidoferrales bacterium]